MVCNASHLQSLELFSLHSQILKHTIEHICSIWDSGRDVRLDSTHIIAVTIEAVIKKEKKSRKALPSDLYLFL